MKTHCFRGIFHAVNPQLSPATPRPRPAASPGAWIQRKASERCAAVGASDAPCRRRASREASPVKGGGSWERFR